MEQKFSFTGFFVTLGLIIVAVLFMVSYSVRQKEETQIIQEEMLRGKDSVIAHLIGKTDSLLKAGRQDTTVIRVPYPVYIEKPTGTQFGKDSTVYQVSNDKGRVEVTTYPATDSVKIEIEPIVIERFITRVDTLVLSRVDSIFVQRTDTLKITVTVPEERPFYDHWEFGAAGATVIGIITAILIGR